MAGCGLPETVRRLDNLSTHPLPSWEGAMGRLAALLLASYKRMLQDVHSRKISQPVDAAVGTTVIIPQAPDEWHYIHELIGDLQAAGFVEVFAVVHATGVQRDLAKFDLTSGQGLTLQDEPGEDNRPRFEFKPGEDAVLVCTGGAFIGSVHWSIRN